MELASMLLQEPAQVSKHAQPKTVAFELLLDEGSKTRARIPLRLLVNPHDTTESIITTVKNFYGIYDGHGVTFEDDQGNILIARHENLLHNSVVYVRTVAAPPQSTTSNGSVQFQGNPVYEPQRRSSLGEPFQMAPPHNYEQSRSPSRSASRMARKRSASPAFGRGRRSASQQKPEPYSASRGSSASGSYRDDAANGYSDSDAGRSSIAGSKKARSEQFASAEISQENVLQDGRRMNSFFDSSVLPLFVPPQVPITTSTSSISPQRRSQLQDGPSPFHPPAQNLNARQAQPPPTPQSYSFQGKALDFPAYGPNLQSASQVPPHGHRLRDRGSAQPNGQVGNGKGGYTGQGVLPTPDPTVASCISDEDVARQLIALGDMSNFSHGRTSNSTLDDTFSGVADVASSTGATSDSDEYSDEEGPLPKQRRLNDDDDQEYENETIIKSELEEYEGEPKTKKIKTKIYDGPSNDYRGSRSGSMKAPKSSKGRSNTLPKAAKPSGISGLMKAPSAPGTVGQPRKTSSSSVLSFQHQLGADEEDLSSKPRCQRCRKSKKGCDRQRPCQRCKDAGIGIEGCVSEDEGNGRKGRYGRHMGVAVKKRTESMSVASDDDDGSHLAGAILTGMASAETTPDKSKKRKR